MEKLTAEVVSSLKDCLGWKEGKPLWGLEEPGPAGIQPPRSKTPRRGRRGTSTGRDLAKVREAHWRALATAATLEEKIERLSWSVTWGQPDAHAHSWSHDCQRRRSWGWSRRHHRVWPEESPVPFFEYSPPQWGPGSGEDKEAKPPLLDFDLEPPLELGPEVDHFLQEPAGSSEEDDRNRSSPEPPVDEYERWVTWRAQAHDMPGWWPELAKIPGMDDHQELAWKVQASFELPWQISEQHGMENYHQTPLALLCICQKDFLPQPDSKFSCWDIRESQLEKMVAYAQALQFWVEKANPPTQGQPCLLARSILELKEAMKCYVSFPNDAVFGGMALPEELLTTQLEKTIPEITQPVSTDSHIEEAAVKVAKEEAGPIAKPLEEPTTSQTPSKEPTRREHSPNWFSGCREVLHSSRPVTAAGQIPLISWSSKQRPHSKSSGEMLAQCQRAEEQIQNTRSEPTSPTGMLETLQQVMPPPGFWEEMICLQRDLLPVFAHEAPPTPYSWQQWWSPLWWQWAPVALWRMRPLGWPTWTPWPLPWGE